MKKEALQERLRDLLETDWEARAAEIRRDHDGVGIDSCTFCKGGRADSSSRTG